MRLPFVESEGAGLVARVRDAGAVAVGVEAVFRREDAEPDGVDELALLGHAAELVVIELGLAVVLVLGADLQAAGVVFVGCELAEGVGGDFQFVSEVVVAVAGEQLAAGARADDAGGGGG